MANIDVTELFCDPDFCDSFTFIRRTEQVDLHGRAQTPLNQTMTGYGSIQPLSGQALRMMPMLSNTQGSIEIWTNTPLQTLTDKLKPDIVCWDGNQYTVTAIPGDFSNWGVGFGRYVGTLHSITSKGTDGQS